MSRSFAVTLLSFFALLCLSGRLSAQQQAVGSIDATFDVSDIGASDYVIPIAVPRGAGGLQPDLAIHYNSSSGNGSLGMGWSLSGLSVITRVPNDIYHDKQAAGVQLNANDKFALDGNRLIVTSGSYGTPASQYHTEIESYKTIVANGQLGTGPASFTVTDAAGRVYEYGATVDAKGTVAGKTEPYMWLLDKVTDLSGNYITYQYYHAANGEVVPLQIQYNANEHIQGSYLKSAVVFLYTAKSDPDFSYVAGGKVASTLKVDRIVSSQSDGSSFKAYRSYFFEYANNFYTHLAKITEKGAENTEQLSPTLFAYGAVSNTPDVASTGSPVNGFSTYISGDFNGDGRSDYITLPQYYNTTNTYNNWDLYLNTGTGYTHAQSVSLGATPSQIKEYGHPAERNYISSFFDYNGDGKEDFFYRDIDPVASGSSVVENHYRLFTSNGTALNELGTIIPGNSSNLPAAFEFLDTYPLMGDFDGDGKTEILVLKGSNNVTSTGPQNFIIGERYLKQYGSYLLAPLLEGMPFDGSYTSVFGAGGSKLFVIDYDGDGKSEVLSLWQSGSVPHAQVFKLNVTFDANNNPVVGNPAFVEVASGSYPTVLHEIFPGDFNGDGITDYLTWLSGTGWKIGYGDGKGTVTEIDAAPGIANKPGVGPNGQVFRPIIISDFNGDGKSDIFDYTPDDPAYNWGTPYAPKVFYAKGNNVFQQSSYSLSASNLNSLLTYYAVGDFNGDGAMDLLSNHARNTIAFRPNEKLHLLSKITNGLGSITKVNYQSLANGTVYSNGTNPYAYPVVKKPVPLKVVASIVEDNGINTAGNTTTFTYEGFKYANQGRGILGFDHIAQHNQALNLTTDKVFGLNTMYLFPFLQSVTVSQGTNKLSSVFSGYGFHDFGSKRIFPYVTESVHTDYLNNTCTKQEFNYDAPPVVFATSGYAIGRPLTITTRKGYSAETVPGQPTEKELTVQTFSFPPFIALPGQPALPFYIRCQPQSVITTTTRTGQPAYTRKINYTYYNPGGLPHIIVTDPGTGKEVTTTCNYDIYGNLVKKITNATGVTTRSETYEYDPFGRFLAHHYNDDFPNIASTSVYIQTTGLVGTFMDADGLHTNYTYDAFGRAAGISDNNGSSTTITRSAASGNAYAPAGAVYMEQNSSNIAAPAYTFYDRLGRVLRTVHSGNDGTPVFEDHTYNIKGQLVKSSKPYFQGSTPQNIAYAYDTYGRLKTETHPEGYTVTHTYQNTSDTHTETITQAGRTRKTTTDNSGRVVSAIDNGGTLTYTYHSSGQPLQVSLDGSVVSQFVYDDFGRKTDMTDPNYGTYHYTYNAFDNLISQKDPKGNTYTFQYNTLGTVTKKTGPEGNYVYTYGTAAGPNCGKLIQQAGPGVTQNYDYGMGDKVNYSERIMGAKTFKTSYTYDAKGRLATMTYPNGKQIAYSYNSTDGSILHIQNTEDMPIKYLYWQHARNAYGQSTDASLGYTATIGGSGSWVARCATGYDDFGLLTEQKATLKNGTVLQDYQYTFAASTGNLSERQDMKYHLKEDFTYDNLDRLKQSAPQIVTPPSTLPNLNVSYAPNGNILQKTDAGTFTYDQANRVSEIQPYADIPAATQTLTFTPFNKVASVTEGVNKVQLSYWADGDRARMQTYQSGVLKKTKYYAADYEEETDASGNVRQLCYVRDPDGKLTTILETRGATDKTYYILTDHLGSITQVLDESGAIVEERSYNAWGRYRNPVNWAALTPTAVTYAFDRGYTGHEYLPQFGIINMNGRLYDPVMGRMFSPDPYIMPAGTQGYNRYTYALNNPLIYTDPNGEWINLVIGAVVGGISNWMMNGAQLNTKGLGYFAVGAAAGVIGMGIGSGLMGGYATSGFISGMVTGASEGLASGVISGAGNAALGNKNFFHEAIKYGAYGVILGGVLGGLSSGIDAVSNGRSFWNGRYSDVQLKRMGINLTGDPVSEDDLQDFFDYNFQDRLHLMEYKPSVSVNDARVGSDAFAKTIPKNGYSVPGPSDIFIKHAALDNDKTLFYTLDHELVHASHFSNGQFALWQSFFGHDRAVAISEYYAYSNGAAHSTLSLFGPQAITLKLWSLQRAFYYFNLH